MYRNYLTTALRQFVKQRSYALLNLLGLTLGMSCAIIIFLFVQDEWSFDAFHQKKDQIYRLTCTYYLPEDAGVEENATAGAVVGQMVDKDFPEVKQVVRIQGRSDRIVQTSNAEKKFFEDILYADSNFFELFSFDLLEGNPRKVLTDPFQIVISEKVALRYFNRTNVVGELLQMPEDYETPFQITGVVKDLPANSHIQFDFLASMETFYTAGLYMDSWWSFSTYTYLEVAEGTDVAALGEKIKLISRTYIPDQEDGSGYRQEYYLQPLEAIHLYSDLRYEISPNNKASTVQIFLVIGIFLLIMACVNFMNLATARSLSRAKEVGLRKVIGATRQQLIGQFLSESSLLAFLSLLLALGLVAIGLESINQFTGKALSLNMTENLWLPLLLLGLVLFVGLFSGSYPALFLSAFRPAETLKGSFKSGKRGVSLRKVLVVGQFTISTVLIISTLMIFSQYSYMRDKDLGFEKEEIVFVPTKYVNQAAQNFQTMKEQLENEPGFLNVTLSSRVPGKNLGNNVVRLGWDEEAEWSDMRYIAVDYDFIETYDLELLAGRAFEESFGTDVEEAFLLNESGMRRLGWNDPEEALGKQLRWQQRRGRVIGVVKDFHFMSVNQAIEPFLMVMNGSRTPGYLSARISTANHREVLDKMEAAFAANVPNGIFEYQFLNEDFDQQYKADEKFQSIFSIFAIIAIIIACLGLYGLSALSAEMKIKEIGIRKVLGASNWDVISLMSRDFTKLVAIAMVIAIPLAWFGLDRWLSTFPYHAPIYVWIFILGGFLALFIASLTISFQAVRSAAGNPVDALSHE
ncbi:MAG: ABC transporter permease [Bacteroidota bacterium]